MDDDFFDLWFIQKMNGKGDSTEGSGISLGELFSLLWFLLKWAAVIATIICFPVLGIIVLCIALKK